MGDAARGFVKLFAGRNGFYRNAFTHHRCEGARKTMAAPDDYRRRAAECLALAQQIANPDDKAKMLEMAEAWRRLAEWHDQQDGKKRDGD